MDIAEKAPSCFENLAISFFREEERATDDAIKSLLTTKAIITKFFLENGEFASPIFACLKHDGTFRFFVNLKSLQDGNSPTSIDLHHIRLLYSYKWL